MPDPLPTDERVAALDRVPAVAGPAAVRPDPYVSERSAIGKSSPSTVRGRVGATQTT